jgi:hypothetical protein
LLVKGVKDRFCNDFSIIICKVIVGPAKKYLRYLQQPIKNLPKFNATISKPPEWRYCTYQLNVTRLPKQADWEM